MVLAAFLCLKAHREELPSCNNSRKSVTWQKQVFFRNSEDLSVSRLSSEASLILSPVLVKLSARSCCPLPLVIFVSFFRSSGFKLFSMSSLLSFRKKGKHRLVNEDVHCTILHVNKNLRAKCNGTCHHSSWEAEAGEFEL